MANVQVTRDANPNNARSESSVAINPSNPRQIVSASKKFADLQTYDFSLATQYSDDGGQSWYESTDLALPAGATVMTDPTLAWDDIGSVYLVGLTGKNPPAWDAIGIVIYKSTDGGKTWSAPKPVHNDPSDDKQWAAGDGNPASPFHGHVYAVWDSAAGMSFVRTTDHGATWTGASGAAAGASIMNGTVYPEIFVSLDGTVYAVSIGGSQIEMIMSSDGGDTFRPTAPPATGVTTLEATLNNVDGWPEFNGGTFRVITDPTIAVHGQTVLVAWADFREGVSRIYYARSIDSGTSWATGSSGLPLLTSELNASFQHFHPQITVDPNGVFACMFYEFGPKPTAMLIDVILAQSLDDGLSFGQFTITDQPWDPAVAAPWAHGDPKVTFIGDYIGLSASNEGFVPVWTDTRTGVQELWTDVVGIRRMVEMLAPSAAVAADGDQFVFWRGTDNNLWQAIKRGAGTWEGPNGLGMGPLGSEPGAGVDGNGATYVYWKGTDNNLWRGYWNGTKWAGPENVGMGTLGSAPTVAVGSNGDQFVFWRGTDNNLWQAIKRGAGTWEGPNGLGMGPLGSEPGAGVDGNGATYVYWKGTDNNLWRGYWNGTKWAGPENVGMGTLGSAPTVAVGSNGDQFVFWRGTDNNLWQAIKRGAGTWEGPNGLGMGPLGSEPGAGVDGNGATYVYWKGTDNNLWRGYWNGTKWAGPENVGMGTLG